MIPKKIHYCWFSGEPYPVSIRNCLESWKRFLPDYEFILWDKSRAESTEITWVQEALQQKKWAFAADAVRLYALEKEGGIYLDTDVEVIKSFTPLLDRDYFFGFENGSKRIEGAVLASIPNHEAIRTALNIYKESKFIYSESNVDEMVLPNILAKTFNSLTEPLEIFSETFFSPKSFMDGKIYSSAETFCIHHFHSNWRPTSVRKGIERRQKLYKKFPVPIAKCLSIPLSLWTNLQTIGFSKTIQKIFKH